MSGSRKWIITGSALGFLGVAIGAIGAHALKPLLTPETSETFRTGVFYHIVHALAILALGLSSREYLLKACRFFLAGIVLFSFSLYPYSITQVKFLAMITPFGGVAFLVGWLTVIILEVRNKEQNSPSGS